MQHKRIGKIITFCGIVLILLSYLTAMFWNESSAHYHNVREGTLVYGFIVSIMGIVLIIVKKISILQLLWGNWICFMGVQLIRLFNKHLFVSHFINSFRTFWGLLLVGGILLIVSICRKFKRIF